MQPLHGSFRGHAATALLLLTLAGVTLFGGLQLSGSLVHGDRTVVRALLPTTSALASGARVTMAGATVGRVEHIERRGSGTLVELAITDDRVLPLTADARVALRQRTPIGENSIAIAQGTAKQPLAKDAILPISSADEYVDVDQVLSTLTGPNRAAVRRLVQATGGALRDRGTGLNRTLGAASTVVREGGSLFGVLAEDRRQLAELVDRLGRLTSAVGDRGEAIGVTAQRGLVALRALAARDGALSATLRELPATLRQARDTSTRLRATATGATPVVSDLAGTLAALRGPVDDLRPAAQQARNAVRELGAAAPPLTRTLGRLRSASTPLSAALPALHRTVCQVAPMVRYTRPYTKDAIAAIVGLGSASNAYDAVGHAIRLMPIVGENSLVGLPDDVTQAAYKLLRSGLLGKASPLTWNPIPEPGVIGTARSSAVGRPAIGGPAALARSGTYRYPHIEADC